MEMHMSIKAKYKESAAQKEFSHGFLHLCPLCTKCGRDATSSLLGMFFCPRLLELCLSPKELPTYQFRRLLLIWRFIWRSLSIIIILAARSIWITRNKTVFQRIDPTYSNWKMLFKKEFAMVIHRAKAKYLPHISEWLNDLHYYYFCLSVVNML